MFLFRLQLRSISYSSGHCFYVLIGTTDIDRQNLCLRQLSNKATEYSLDLCISEEIASDIKMRTVEKTAFAFGTKIVGLSRAESSKIYSQDLLRLSRAFRAWLMLVRIFQETMM